MIPHGVCGTMSTINTLPHVLTFLNVDRTSELRKKGYQGRRLGPVQMTTDTAVRVTRIIVQDKSNLAFPTVYECSPLTVYSTS
jgi:hypothetical protein